MHDLLERASSCCASSPSSYLDIVVDRAHFPSDKLCSIHRNYQQNAKVTRRRNIRIVSLSRSSRWETETKSTDSKLIRPERSVDDSSPSTVERSKEDITVCPTTKTNEDNNKLGRLPPLRTRSRSEGDVRNIVEKPPSLMLQAVPLKSARTFSFGRSSRVNPSAISVYLPSTTQQQAPPLHHIRSLSSIRVNISHKQQGGIPRLYT
jgi:transglutaminase/protease-like cytokinesis protein 3